jgi:hypothetical protein
MTFHFMTALTERGRKFRYPAGQNKLALTSHIQKIAGYGL